MTEVGVVVGRFQVDTPHEGHKALINKVHERHEKVLICVGCARIRLSIEDPLDYPTRERMMRRVFPWATVVPIDDQPTDEAWSANLDRVIKTIFPTDKAILYGSRKSFIPHYKGTWPVMELFSVAVTSATQLREQIMQKVRDSEDFRAGVIYACGNRFPISYQTVDVAILKNSEVGAKFSDVQVLLCRKPNEEKFSFIGGFVDTKDESLEAAARREVSEEAHIEVSSPQYLSSCPVDDWRYRGRGDRIMTSFFVADDTFGSPKADDDIIGLEWVFLGEIKKVLIERHLPMVDKLIDYVNKTVAKK